MFILQVETSFEAAHRLENYEGPCSRLHGHHWRIRAKWKKRDQDQNGIALDFAFLKKELRYAMHGLDHSLLNKNENLSKPTSENLAKLIFRRLEGRERSQSQYLMSVTVEETPGCKVCYWRDKNGKADANANVSK